MGIVVVIVIVVIVVVVVVIVVVVVVDRWTVVCSAVHSSRVCDIASLRSLVVCAPIVALVVRLFVRAPGTLQRVRITGEMQHLRGDIGTKIMSSVARLSAAGCRFDFA